MYAVTTCSTRNKMTYDTPEPVARAQKEGRRDVTHDGPPVSHRKLPMSTLPRTEPEIEFISGEPTGGFIPVIDHEDEQYTTEDFETRAMMDLDAFLPRGLDLPSWLDQQARQHRLRTDPRHLWLADQIARLAQLTRWTGATTTQEHDDRMEVYDLELRGRSYEAGYQDGRTGATARCL